MKAHDKWIEPSQRFSWKGRCNSFVYAWNGIVSFFKTEHNAQLHLLSAVIVVTLSILLQVSRTEAIAVAFAVGFVWVTEMLNTAIEKAMDFISIEKHPQIKLVKDIAAGAVLIASLVALIIGILIFLPKILSL